MNSLSLGEVKKTSRSLQIVDIFKNALANGTFKIGDKLPPERELAEILGAGRSSLREAISILSAYGIVESRQGEGTFITDKFIDSVFDFFGFTNITNQQNYLNLMQMREVFEVGSVKQIVANVTEEDLTAMAGYIDGFEKAPTHQEKAAYDLKFHEHLIHCTGNPLFIRIYKMSLKLLYSLIDGLLPHVDVQKAAHREHGEILKALKSRDVEQGRIAVGNHLEHISLFIKKYHKPNAG